MDVLTSVLASIRLEGTVFSQARLSAPWGVLSKQVPFGIFHAVMEGQACLVDPESGDSFALRTGDVAFLTRGDAHVMCSTRESRPVPIEEHITDLPDSPVSLLEVEGGGARTTLICGRFDMGEQGVHPLFSQLPRILHIAIDEGKWGRWIRQTQEMIWQELLAWTEGSEVIITRLTDVLLIYALRQYIQALPDGVEGWMGALKDPQVAHAMGLIHQKPERTWTATGLAKAVGMSRSSFFARFSRLVGMPPHRYLTMWRMHLASRLLCRADLSMGEIAERVGYHAEGAFRKAFKRCVGVAPGRYRREQQESVVH